MAIKSNIVIDQGSTFSVAIDLRNNDNSGPFDLTGYNIFAQMRKSYYSSQKVDFTCTHNGSAGQIMVALTSTQTEAITPGRYLYDVEIVSPTNVITRVVEGIATVTPGITRV